MGRESKKTKRFLTVYTISQADKIPNWPISFTSYGCYLRRGDAIRELAEMVLSDIEIRDHERSLARENKVLVEALKYAKMPNDDMDELFGAHEEGWKIPLKIRQAMKAAIIDEIGGESCYIIKDDAGLYEFRYDIDESGVEGKGGIQLYACITSGKDNECYDPEYERACPEVFLSYKDAETCAIDDLRTCLDGYDNIRKSEIVMEAKEALSENGYYMFEINDRMSRRWDIWSTPLDVGDGVDKPQRA